MNDYDPLEAPDAARWLALDESERINLIVDFHRRRRIKMLNMHIHAVMHATVESQVAMGEEIPVAHTLARLMVEGLDRHDAIHAIGSVLVKHLQTIMASDDERPDPNAEYWNELEALGADTWRDTR